MGLVPFARSDSRYGLLVWSRTGWHPSLPRQNDRFPGMGGSGANRTEVTMRMFLRDVLGDRGDKVTRGNSGGKQCGSGRGQKCTPDHGSPVAPSARYRSGRRDGSEHQPLKARAVCHCPLFTIPYFLSRRHADGLLPTDLANARLK
jgi:hypothetical protein